MTIGKKIGIGILLCAVVVLVLVFGTTDVHEDGIVRFRVKGMVFDASLRAPLGGVEVLLLLDGSSVNDKKALNDLFELYSPMWEDPLEPSEWVGKSREDGEYVAEGSRGYSRRYVSLFGLGGPKGQPFPEAWLVFRKDGYKIDVVEVKTLGWKHADISEDTFNAAEHVYLEKQ
ncbi:MAG: hypothetical protein ABID83_01810 [Candidatus Omnitrophota bacterium]